VALWDTPEAVPARRVLTRELAPEERPTCRNAPAPTAATTNPPATFAFQPLDTSLVTAATAPPLLAAAGSTPAIATLPNAATSVAGAASAELVESIPANAADDKTTPARRR